MYRAYPHLSSVAVSRTNVKRADPFIVALAATRGARVVTSEGKKEWGIPDVCGRFGIDCHDLDGMMMNEGWTF